jgi:hypothetical protein
VYAMRVDFSDLVFSLSSDRHSYIGLVLNSHKDKELFMKDKEQKLDEISSSHTLGGSGEGSVQGRRKCRG